MHDQQPCISPVYVMLSLILKYDPPWTFFLQLESKILTFVHNNFWNCLAPPDIFRITNEVEFMNDLLFEFLIRNTQSNVLSPQLRGFFCSYTFKFHLEFS